MRFSDAGSPSSSARKTLKRVSSAFSSLTTRSIVSGGSWFGRCAFSSTVTWRARSGSSPTPFSAAARSSSYASRRERMVRISVSSRALSSSHRCSPVVCWFQAASCAARRIGSSSASSASTRSRTLTRALRRAPRRRVPGRVDRSRCGTAARAFVRDRLRHRAEPLGEAVALAHVGLEVDRRQVARRADSLPLELGDHALAVAALVELDDVDEPRAHVVGVVGQRRARALDAGQQLVVARGRLARAGAGSRRASRAGRARARPGCRRSGS